MSITLNRGASAAPARPENRRASGLLNSLPTIASVAILLLMFVYGEIAYGKIFQYNTLSNLLINSSYLIILAVGMTFVILTGGIDLSVGSVIAVSSLTGVMLANAGLPMIAVVLVTVAVGAAFGLVSGILVQYFNVQPFIATLAMMFLARGIASMMATTPVRLEDDSSVRSLSTSIKLIDGPKTNDLVITPSVIITIVVVVVAAIVLKRTRFGRTVYGLGGSETSAGLMGLPVARTKLWVYVISGTLAGLAAVVYASRTGMAQNVTGVGWELDAIAAVVIGGTMLTGGFGFVLGSVVGALVIGMMTLLITRDGTVPPEATTIITGAILLGFVLLQRAVLLRRKKA